MKDTWKANLINILELLQAEGIDVSQIPLSKSKGKKQESTTIADINQPGVSIEDIIIKHGLDGKYKIGMMISNSRGAYRGRTRYALTEKDKRRIEALGIIKIEDLEEEQQRLIEQISKAQELMQRAQQLSENVIEEQ